MPKDTRLTARVEEDEIVIRLGIDCLKDMTESFEPFGNSVTVTDPAGWAQAVAEQIGASNSDDQPESLAQEMFEAAIDEASATGGRWLEVIDSDKE